MLRETNSLKKLLLIDGNSVAFRAFYALYKQLDKFKSPEGLHTNAIFTFKNMLDVLLKNIQPTHMLVAFDAGKITFRNKMYADYKGGRDKTPNELSEQLPIIKELLAYLGIKSYELSNYEADDILGTMAKMGTDLGFEVTIVTGDRDLTQLAGEHVTVMVTKKGVNDLEIYTPKHMQEVYGVTPKQFIDVKALMGDASDNYPGVEKVGAKTASKLINQYGSVENLYEKIDQIKASKIKEYLIRDKNNAILGKKLATIDCTSPVDLKIDDVKLQAQQLTQLRSFYERLGFKKFLSELPDVEEIDNKVQDECHYEILDKDNLSEIFATDFDHISFNLEMIGDNYHLAQYAGFSVKIKQKIYVCDDVMLLQETPLKKILEDKNIAKQVFDLKRNYVGLQRLGITLSNVTDDIMLASYIADSENNAGDLGVLANSYQEFYVQSDEIIYGKGKKQHSVDVDTLYAHMATKVDVLDKLKAKIMPELQQHEQLHLYKNIEIPIAVILAKMEIAGIKVQATTLVKMKNDLDVRITDLKNKIYQLAGEKFNINSPKQLGVILFEKLKLTPAKKTKTGYSTSVDVLEKLEYQSPIVADILDYRQISKIQSTYINGLLDYIQADGKIHTRFLQTLTTTGRLSSVEPNLQNIPVKLEEGKQIRKAFVPCKQDSYLFSCDYSQVELRVLAHVSHEKNMLEAFKEGYDIHAHTAMKIFGLSNLDEVTPLMRRHAKAVNFGIVYGISDYGLAKNLGISRQEAQNFINNYFEQYPQIKDYMKAAVKLAREKGYAETIMHRRRLLPDIHNKNFNIRSFAERTAINSPIQGSAADIIKIAMIKMQSELERRKLKTKMILQIHDELLFDVPSEELDLIKILVPKIMQQAAQLDVPLIADANWGHNWYEVK